MFFEFTSIGNHNKGNLRYLLEQVVILSGREVFVFSRVSSVAIFSQKFEIGSNRPVKMTQPSALLFGDASSDNSKCV